MPSTNRSDAEGTRRPGCPTDPAPPGPRLRFGVGVAGYYLGVGTFNWPLRISAMDSPETAEIEATVDTGAAYTTLPACLLRNLGVEPIGRRRFLLADGRRVDMDYGRAWVTVGGESEVTLVVFGADDAPALLGAYTLEGLALAVDPVEQRLVPTHLIMYRMAACQTEGESSWTSN